MEGKTTEIGDVLRGPRASRLPWLENLNSDFVN